MTDQRWPTLANRLGLPVDGDCLCGTRDGYPVGVTSRAGHTWLGLIVENRERQNWTLTRRWEPQARAPRRPDSRTVRFKDLRLTERYVGAADDPRWFRDALPASVAERLVVAADANRLGACTLRLRSHVLLAHYRDVPETIPDLGETLAALCALARALDGTAATIPDVSRVPLLDRAGLDAVPARRIDCGRDGITIRLAASRAGVLGVFHSRARARLDWQTARFHTPEWEIGAACLRQIVAWEDGGDCTLVFVDTAGAPAFAASAPKWRIEPGSWTRGERPYLVAVRS